jgi:leucyl aminopeptidase
MKITHCDKIEGRSKADLLVIPLVIEKQKVRWPSDLKTLAKSYHAPVETGDFSGKEGETALLYPQSAKESRVLLLGLGELGSITTENLRRAFSAVVKIANKLGASHLNVYVPELSHLSDDQLFRGISEGLFLTNYRFHHLKGEKSKKDAKKMIEQIELISHSKKAKSLVEKYWTLSEGVFEARDMVNGNADEINPDYLAEWTKKLSQKYPRIKTKVLDKKALQKEGLGLLVAVGRASPHGPCLIVAEYQGNPKSKDKTLLVGKGVTYDTGGLNLKPTGSMETMKCDMGGAACVLATLAVASRLNLKVNIVVIVPATENSIASESYKPGDVYKSFAGKTVEISNTDAEGRLILADALSYGITHYKPNRIVDLATLTGAIEIALGNECSGLFSNNDALADALIRSGSETFERLWRMPLHDEYKEALKSDIADMKNHGGRSGGSITAAQFLHEFVGNTPWAHIDIAGTAYINEAKRYLPRYATGVGVRLLIDLLEGLQDEQKK